MNCRLDENMRQRAVKKEKQPLKGPREPVNKTARDQDPRNCEQRRAMPTVGEIYRATRGSTTRGEERNTVLQVRKLDNKFAQDESNVIINTDQKGSCLSPRQRISQTRMKPISRRSRTVWFGQSETNVLCPVL